jgi:hypothetical protein
LSVKVLSFRQRYVIHKNLQVPSILIRKLLADLGLGHGDCVLLYEERVFFRLQ